MTIKEEYTRTEDANLGLDRADINKHGQIEIPSDAPNSSHDRRFEDSDEERKKNSSLHRLHVSLSEKKHGAATKIKKTLHISKPTETDVNVDVELQEDTSVLANPVTDKSESRLREKLTVPDKATAKDFIKSPISTVKDKVGGQGNQEVAANIAAREISHGQDVELLNAHRDLLDEEKKQGGAEGKKVRKKRETFEELMKERQNMFVRWTLDRHVTKVRVLPRSTVVRKSKKHFTMPNGDVDWKKYGQHLAEYAAQQYGGQYIGYGTDNPPPSKKTIMPNLERLIVASAPFQEMIMTARRVYRWEHPAETGKYLAVYCVLWYLDMLLPGMLSAIVYLVIQRKFFKPSLVDLHQDIERTENQKVTALSLTEFIGKEGEEEWADKILQEVGPWLMIQLSDMANFFEVTRNFYEWRVPSRTIATLSILIAVVLATAITPAWLFIRVMTLGMGISFFGLFPFAVNFPEYRLLASLPKRIFWNIPTHAEWSIKALQAEGTRYQQTHPVPLPTSTSSSSAPPTVDYGHYTASLVIPSLTSSKDTETTTKGRITISSASLHFTSHHDKVIFTLPYKDIERVEKVDRMIQQTLPIGKLKSDSGMDLKIVGRVGFALSGGPGGVVKNEQVQKREWVMENVDKRNQVFSQLLGFNEGTWQVVW